jgi:organic hydroperoxide reductase OsmC/OhrA
MNRTHEYRVEVEWSDPAGTVDYGSYPRRHLLTGPADAAIAASADRVFGGDPRLWNPEQLLVAAAADCHLLSYLALCALRGVVVVDYVDSAVGTMVDTPGAGGRFTGIELFPRVTIAVDSDPERALELHDEAATQCYIAASLNFPVRHHPTVVVSAEG